MGFTLQDLSRSNTSSTSGAKWYEVELAKKWGCSVKQAQKKLNVMNTNNKKSQVSHYENDKASNGMTYQQAYNTIRTIESKHMAREIRTQRQSAYISQRSVSVDVIIASGNLSTDEKKSLEDSINAIRELEEKNPASRSIAAERNGNVVYTTPLFNKNCFNLIS